MQLQPRICGAGSCIAWIKSMGKMGEKLDSSIILLEHVPNCLRPRYVLASGSRPLMYVSLFPSTSTPTTGLSGKPAADAWTTVD